VRNESHPMGARFNKFIEACAIFGQFVGLPLQKVYDAIGQFIGFNNSERPSENEMVAGADLLEFEYARLLEARRTYDERRRLAKRRGQRKATTRLFADVPPPEFLVSKFPDVQWPPAGFDKSCAEFVGARPPFLLRRLMRWLRR